MLEVKEVHDEAVVFFQVHFGEWSTDMKGATLELLGIEKGNGTTLTRKHNISAIDLSNVSDCFFCMW